MKIFNPNIEKQVLIEDAKLILKNFSGRGGKYNEEGKRNFGILLPSELAMRMEEAQWAVKYFEPFEDDPEQRPVPWIKVQVKFGNYPPTVVLIANGRKHRLDEDLIDQLDWTRISVCDVRIRAYNHDNGKKYAYLHTIYATAEEDDLASKYADFPDEDDE